MLSEVNMLSENPVSKDGEKKKKEELEQHTDIDSYKNHVKYKMNK